MKTQRLCPLILALIPLSPCAVWSATIFQTASSSYVAFEAEGNPNIIPGTPETWISTNDAAASGGAVLYADGSNSTGNSPHSFAQYKIKFASPGTYYLYYRWKADPNRTGGDAFTANSTWIGSTFGAYSTPGDQTTYYRSDSNNDSAPTDNVFAWRKEPDSVVYSVSAADVSATSPLILTLGTREAGMVFDRFVFSTDNTLAGAQLDALVNSDTEIVIQGAADNFVAFEADGPKAFIIPGTPESWISTNDAAASGGSVLYANGNNSTADSPHSFVQYQLKFATAGTYYLYYRWKADPNRTGGDAFTANSSWIGTTFGAYSTIADQTPYYRSDSNNDSAPNDNVFAWRKEPDSVNYTVTAADVTAGKPLVLTIGTREAGMEFDRLVLSPDNTLTTAQLDALPNSGAKPVAPEIAKAVGSATLTTVTIVFTRPLATASVSAGKFSFDGGLTASAATVDSNDPRIVVLTTSQQTQGQPYKVTVNGVTDTSGTPNPPNTSANFTAWRIVSGWATKEIYFTINGTTVADLTGDPKYPSKPDRYQWIKGFQMNDDPLTDNYGARLMAFFVPSASEAYSFYINNDDEAELQLSTDQTQANLQSLGLFSTSPRVFDDAITASSPPLTANGRYLLMGLLKQGTGQAYLNVAAKRQSDSTPAANLQALSGEQIATWINPDLGSVKFTQQPANATVPAGSRARFSVTATSDESPLYYQWRANGVPIAGATLAAYVTPSLTTADSGKTYDVVVSVAGRDTASTAATVTVTPGQPSNVQPYLGINFVGGGTFGGATLSPGDVTGVVMQENWNNLQGFTFDQAQLGDGAGAATPVTLSTDPAPNAPTEVWYSGTKSLATADGLLMQGFINAVAGTDPINIRLSHVPPGTYNLLVYSLGFDFSANYYQSYAVTGSGTYPLYHGKAETGLNFIANPAFRRISSTTTNQVVTGNYVQFDNVSPASDGSLLIAITWEPFDSSINNSHQPAISAIQLAKVLPVTVNPSLSATVTQPGTLVLSWPASAAGFVLESSTKLGSDVVWTVVPGAPNPISGAGSTSVSTSSGTQYYRLRK